MKEKKQDLCTPFINSDGGHTGVTWPDIQAWCLYKSREKGLSHRYMGRSHDNKATNGSYSTTNKKSGSIQWERGPADL